ncbi:acyltransferase [Duganella sp. LjRoot269]|jgi:surface polysaccharide O-acyltransferase-like enzyme|uniref:acyltransferase n=1 Tax=Duganella sp. LjRoot269 TaxID=3342305 RepID=UPI003ECCF938
MSPPPAHQSGVARDLSLEGMRSVAILFVITIHIAAKGFGALGPHWWAVNAYESVSRVAVPLFFMITGALLLPRRHTVPAIASRLWRVGLPLLCWSVLYLLWFRHANQHQSGWLARIIQAPVVAHLWYLYTLIGAYLFLPVLAGFHQANTVRVQLFCLFFWFVGASVVPLEVALTGREHVGVSWAFLSLYGGYMAAGALIYRHLPARPPRAYAAWLLWAGATAAVAGLTWWQCDRLARADETFYVYSSPPVLIGALAAFVALRSLFSRPLPVLLQRLFTAIGRVSFGVYLLHVLVLFYLDTLGYDFQFINPWLAIPCLALGVLALCGALVRLLQAVPLLRLIVPH